MPRNLPKTDSDEREFIQFRGPQTSVTIDAVGVHFGTEHRGEQICHEPLPVVDPDADPDDVPDNAVARPVAEELVESNPLICWGVCCEHVDDDSDADAEPCGDVFATPKGEASHRSVHSSESDESADASPSTKGE